MANMSDVVGKSKKTRGSSSFAGNGSTVSIAHGLGSVPSYVDVQPTTDPSGFLGETWVAKDATNIYVGNSGPHTGAFDYEVRT